MVDAAEAEAQIEYFKRKIKESIDKVKAELAVLEALSAGDKGFYLPIGHEFAISKLINQAEDKLKESINYWNAKKQKQK